MPLPAPILDDRSYEQLRDELIRRIPVYTPEWTDVNASDPGVTLIELFAFLGENLLYRFNQIPEATYLAFLRLLDLPLRPACPARVTAAATTRDAGGVLVPRGTAAPAGALRFETLTEVNVWPVSCRAVVRALAPAPTGGDQAAFAGRAVDAIGPLAAGERHVFYVNEVVPADPLAPDAVVVDTATAVDGCLWIAVVADTDDAAVEPMLGRTLSIGVAPDSRVTGIDDVDACPGEGRSTNGPAGGPSVLWEVSTQDLRDADGRPVYEPAALAGDTTGGLARAGIVTLRLPRARERLGVYDLPDPDLRGTGSFPPDLGDDRLRVLFWVRASRRDGGSMGRVTWVGVNAVALEQARTAPPEFLGTGTGDAGQRCTLSQGPVIPDSLTVDVEAADGSWRSWTRVDAFHASAEDSTHYTVDPEAREIRFGDGVRGRAPQIGERIRARTYRYGGGAEGNVAAGALSTLEGFATVKASNPLPGAGGADAEAVDTALERIPGELRRHDRAVTSGDFRELALQTPGAGVGRAECLPLFHPRMPDGAPAAGVVSVVIWPREDRVHPTAPMPDRGLIGAVCRWLDARRLVTTELHVIPPTYRPVAVAVGVQVRPGYDVDAVTTWVERVVRQYLSPLPPFGPEGTGWPLGRRVYGPELEAAALQVEGVEYLEGCEVATRDAAGRWTPAPGGVRLRAHEVPELVRITVVQGTPLVAGDPAEPPATDTVPVPVPTVRECC